MHGESSEASTHLTQACPSKFIPRVPICVRVLGLGLRRVFRVKSETPNSETFYNLMSDGPLDPNNLEPVRPYTPYYTSK